MNKVLKKADNPNILCFFCTTNFHQMLKIGHRGAKGYVAENTLQSFQKAIDLKVDGIELDVHLSSDKKVIVIHDETIDRTTSNKGFVNNFTSAELQQLNIPTLEEVIDLVHQQCFINIEIKEAKATLEVLKIIEKYPKQIFQISSFEWEILEIISKENPEINLGVLTEDNLEDALAFAKKIKAKSINPYFKLLHSENVKRIHENKFKIFTWTVNQPEDITFVKSLAVDGIISDFPDRI